MLELEHTKGREHAKVLCKLYFKDSEYCEYLEY